MFLVLFLPVHQRHDRWMRDLAKRMNWRKLQVETMAGRWKVAFKTRFTRRGRDVAA